MSSTHSPPYCVKLPPQSSSQNDSDVRRHPQLTAHSIAGTRWYSHNLPRARKPRVETCWPRCWRSSPCAPRTHVLGKPWPILCVLCVLESHCDFILGYPHGFSLSWTRNSRKMSLASSEHLGRLGSDFQRIFCRSHSIDKNARERACTSNLLQTEHIRTLLCHIMPSQPPTNKDQMHRMQPLRVRFPVPSHNFWYTFSRFNVLYSPQPHLDNVKCWAYWGLLPAPTRRPIWEITPVDSMDE